MILKKEEDEMALRWLARKKLLSCYLFAAQILSNF
jgi:hypothetical protein